MTEITKADILRKVYAAHAQERRSDDICRALDLPLTTYIKADMMTTRVMKHPNWRNQRSPHALMIDCIWIVAMKQGKKRSQSQMVKATKEVFGVGTQPRPNIWWKENWAQELVEEIL